MTFKGWPVEAIEFFEGLEADNSKSYWQEHRPIYDQAVRAPMDELLSTLTAEFGEGKVFRPNRDIRFSADKSPYKTAIAGTLALGGYIQLSSAGLGAGTGMYVMASDQLDRFRRSVSADATGMKLEKLVAGLAKSGIEVSAHESLKSAPKGYPKDHPRIELLRQKGLIAWRQWPAAAWLGTTGAKTRIVDFFRAAKPLTAWLDANVGPSTLPDAGWGR